MVEPNDEQKTKYYENKGAMNPNEERTKFTKLNYAAELGEAKYILYH